MADKRKRSILKAITWRVFSSCVTITLLFILTNQVYIAIGVGVLDLLIKFMLYYIHERLWIKVNWGRE